MSKYLKKFEDKFLGNAPPIPFHSKPSHHTGGHAQSPSQHRMSANAVYYPNYRVYQGDTPAKMNYDCISHVFYAFAHVAPEGRVFLSDEWADVQMDVDGSKGCLGSLVAIKQQRPHLKIILSIGGGAASENFAIVAADAARRDSFARSARSLVDNHQLDGIDIDWEHPNSEQQGRDFIALLAAIRVHLPDERYLLTAALPAGQWALENIDLVHAHRYLNFIGLMAYDFKGSWTPKAGHHAQLHSHDPSTPSAAAAVDYTLSIGVPSHKILLGIPVYGRSFLGCNRPGENHGGHGGEEGTFEYKELPRPGTNEVVDHTAVAASCTGGDGGFVTYDNAETVSIKGRYAREKRLGGLFYWTGTADVVGPRSLVAAGFRALHSH